MSLIHHDRTILIWAFDATTESSFRMRLVMLATSFVVSLYKPNSNLDKPPIAVRSGSEVRRVLDSGANYMHLL